MENQVFRQKSMERISSPEQLQDYMRVTNPGIWMVLAAAIALLVGFIIASSVVRLESSVPAVGQYADGAISIELPLAQKDTVQPGKAVRVAGLDAHVESVRQDDKSLVAVARLDDEDAALPEGACEVEIVTEELSPISFLLN